MTEEQVAAILAALEAVRGNQAAVLAVLEAIQTNQANIFAAVCVVGGFVIAGFLVTVFFLILNKH